MEFEQFQHLFNTLKSENNEERGEAEEIYNNLLSSNGMMVVAYLIQISQTNQISLLFSLILLKNVFKMCPEIILGDQTNDENIQSFLLNLIDNPTEEESIQLTSSSLIAIAAELYLQNQRWPSFQSDIIERCSSQNIFSTLISLDCLILSIHKEFIDIQTVASLMDELYQMIWPTDPNNAHLLIIRLIFILAKNQCSCQCFPEFIANFPEFIANLPAQLANKILSELTNDTDIIIHFFGENFGSLFECLQNLFLNDQLDKGERELALEVIVEITESNPKEMRQCTEAIFNSIMTVICEFNEQEFLEDDFEDPTPRTSAEKSISRITSCYKKEPDFQVLVEYIYSTFEQIKENADSPKQYRVGLVLLRETIKYLSFFFQEVTRSQPLVDFIMAGTQIPANYCQIASFQLLSKSASYLYPLFQKNYNYLFIPPLIENIKSNSELSKYELESLSRIISGSDDEDIDSYLSSLYEMLVSVFGSLPIQSQILDLNCISSLISKTGLKMEFYYQQISSVLAEVIQSDNLALALPALEAFSKIGTVYVYEDFVSNAKSCIDFIISVKRDNFTDNQNDIINSAITAFAMTLGSNFPDEFSQLMLSVIKVAGQTVSPMELPLSTDRSDYNDEHYILVPNEKENTLYIYNRHQLDEIYHSLPALHSILLEIDEFIIQYYQNLVELFIKTISYYFYDEIQSETISCLQALIVALAANQETNYNPFSLIIDSYNDIILQNFQNFEVMIQFLDLCVLITECITDPSTVETQLLESFLLLVLKSNQKCLTEEQDDDETTFLQLKMFAYTYIGKILKFITKCPQINEEISKKLHSLSEQEFSLSAETPSFALPGVIIFWISFVINILNDSNSFNNILQFICSLLNDPDKALDNKVLENLLMALPESIESSLFKDEYLSFFVPALLEFLSLIDSADTEMKDAVDAGIYVLTCLFQKYQDLLNNNDLINLWFNSLPLKENKDPCFKKVYDLLFVLISQNNEVLTQNLTQLLKVIAEATDDSNSSDETRENLRGFVQSISSNPQTQNDFENSFIELSQTDKNRIGYLLEVEQEEN